MTDRYPRDFEVVPITKAKAADDIPSALRRLADDIESDEYGLLTSCVVVIGHTASGPGGEDFTVQQERYYTFGMGPRHDPFTVRGLLMAAATDLNGSSTQD